MITWQIEERIFSLKYQWRISRNNSTEKNNSFVTATENGISGMGEAAPNIRYNETPEILRYEWARFIASGPESCADVHELERLLDFLHLPNALRFAIESAYVHFYCKKKGINVFYFLGLSPAKHIKTAFSLPIMPVADIKGFIEENNLLRFPMLKLKVNRENAAELVHTVADIYRMPLRIDANEAFQTLDECLKFMKHIEGLPVEFIEQPLPAGMEDEYIFLKKHSPLPLMADESVLDKPDFDSLEKQFHGINMKLMKAGGYLNGVRILKEARNRGLKTMIGCMVESTLGISSAMYLCSLVDYVDLDGSLIIKDEPFGLVNENNGELSFV